MPASTEDWATDTAAPEDRRKSKRTKPLLQGQATAATWHWPAAGYKEVHTASGPSSSSPEKRRQVRWKHPPGHFQLQPPAESLKQRYKNLRVGLKSLQIYYLGCIWVIRTQKLLIWQSRRLVKPSSLCQRCFHAECQKVQCGVYFYSCKEMLLEKHFCREPHIQQENIMQM